MAIDTASLPDEITDQDVPELWPLLTPEHQQIVREITRAFAILDHSIVDEQPALAAEPTPSDEETWRAEQRKRNAGAIALLQSWISEAENATPEELAEGEAELEEFKQRLNANRAPLPPLFP